MCRLFLSVWMAATTAWLAAQPYSVSAEERTFIVEYYTPDLEAQKEQWYSRFEVAPKSVDIRSVIDRLDAWNSLTMPLSVCFKDGSSQARRRVRDAASAWEVDGSAIKFDWGNTFRPRDCDTTNHPIRITFKGAGVRALSGRESVRNSQYYLPSMWLGGFDTAVSLTDDEFNLWVAHEFGHVLGFVHEHQGAGVDCYAEYNLEALSARLKADPYGWSDDQIEENLKQLFITDPLTNGFDRSSIMLYSFDKQYYKLEDASQCYHPGVVYPSPGDLALARKRYPPLAGEVEAVSRQILERRGQLKRQLLETIQQGQFDHAKKLSASREVELL